jgi:hypothetical protein
MKIYLKMLNGVYWLRWRFIGLFLYICLRGVSWWILGIEVRELEILVWCLVIRLFCGNCEMMMGRYSCN